VTTDQDTPAATRNPDGITHADGVRALRKAGYTDDDIAQLIEVTGHDERGAPVWRWRTEARPVTPSPDESVM
jgi:hypothetical protein